MNNKIHDKEQSMKSLHSKTRLHTIAATLALCLCLLTCITTNTNAQPTYPPTVSLETLQKHIDQAPKTHPRLYINQQGFDTLRDTSKKDKLSKSLAEAIVKQADVILGKPPIERVLQGRRLLGQSRRCVQRVARLAVAYHLTGKDQYAKRCEQEMLAAAAFKDWNPSHFLDVGEMTFALAIGYDWLYHQLPESSRQKIREAIIQKGVILPFETNHKGWVRSTNNWGQVCHGGLTAGALAVMEDEPQLAARTVHNALMNVTRSMQAFAPKGSYPEGPGYWSYGTTYNVLLNAAIESVLGSDFGLSLAPGFSETGQYLPMVTGPSGKTFNYADGGAGRSSESAIFWFAQKYNRPDWLIHEPEMLADDIDSLRRSDREVGDRFFPFTLLWLEKRPDNFSIQMPLHWSSEGHVPITIHRSSWTDPNAVFIGLKAGSPSANHGNMDTGSFVLDADGQRWAVDLGAEGYHGIESRGMNLWDRSQNSDRWTIFRQQNHGHNTLVINNQLQVAKNAGKFIRFSDDPTHPYSIVDLSPVYEGQAKSVQRGVTLLSSNEILIQDELTGLKPGSKVRWGMITPAKPAKNEKTVIQIEQEGKSMQLHNLSPGSNTPWQIIDTATPKKEWDSPNRGTCMVALEAVAPSNGKMTIAIVLTPGSCKKSQAHSLSVKSLKEW
jgi:hypothetical protein